MKQGIGLKIIVCVLILVIAILSFTKLANHFSNPETYGKIIEKLEEEKKTTLLITTAATATSVAITLLPGDTASSVADQLARVNGYCLLVSTAVVAEKYLLTIIGYLVFKFLVPIICVLACIFILMKKEWSGRILFKLMIMSIALMCAIPLSVQVDKLIENTHNQTVEQALEKAEEAKKDMTKLSQITTTVQVAVDNFMEAVAVMIVINLVMPILTLLFLIWIINITIGINFKLKVPKVRIPTRGELEDEE